MFSLNTLKKLYTDSPLWIKNIYASIPYEIRNGKDYRKYRAFLKKNIDLEEYEIMALKETILYAYNNTQYYNKLFNLHDISPLNINSRKDLNNIPCITKDIVRENFDEFKAISYSQKQTFYVTTGGSSGDPMKFLQSTNVWKKELAYVSHYLEKYGYYTNEVRVSFRGGEFNTSDGSFWKNNPIYNEVHFSPFHLGRDTIEQYASKLDEINAKMYLTYPSSLLLLIDCLEDKGIELKFHPKLILLISENMSEYEIDKIKNYFKNTNVISLYGHSERLIFGISSNDLLDGYRIDRRYGLFELVDEEGQAIMENNREGEIVGTSFDNWAMPLIRYKTGDYADYLDIDEYRTSLIKGRWTQEYLTGFNGSKIFLSALNMHSDIFKNIQQYQFQELEPGKVELLVIPKKNFTLKDEQRILEALQKRVGKNIIFSIKRVDKMILTPRGKIKKIIKRT